MNELEDIHAIRGPVEIFSSWQEWMPYLIGIGAVLLLVSLYFIGRAIRKRRLSAESIPEQPQLSPYEQAMATLQASQKFMQPGEDKMLALMLSDAIRCYLENEYTLAAPEKTTEEFLHEMNQDILFKEKTLKILTQFLEKCDLAKFAKRAFTSTEQEGLYNNAHSFLERTYEERPGTSTDEPLLQETKR